MVTPAKCELRSSKFIWLWSESFRQDRRRCCIGECYVGIFPERREKAARMQIAGIFPICLTNLSMQRTETMPSGLGNMLRSKSFKPRFDYFRSHVSTLAVSNMLTISQSDASVEKRGFRASWKTEPQTCGGDLVATSQIQVLASPNYPEPYPGGLECVYTITTTPGKIVTLEVNPEINVHALSSRTLQSVSFKGHDHLKYSHIFSLVQFDPYCLF